MSLRRIRQVCSRFPPLIPDEPWHITSAVYSLETLVKLQDGLRSQCSAYGLEGSMKVLRNDMMDPKKRAISLATRIGDFCVYSGGSKSCIPNTGERIGECVAHRPVAVFPRIVLRRLAEPGIFSRRLLLRLPLTLQNSYESCM